MQRSQDKGISVSTLWAFTCQPFSTTLGRATKMLVSRKSFKSRRIIRNLRTKNAMHRIHQDRAKTPSFHLLTLTLRATTNLQMHISLGKNILRKIGQMAEWWSTMVSWLRDKPSSRSTMTTTNPRKRIIKALISLLPMLIFSSHLREKKSNPPCRQAWTWSCLVWTKWPQLMIWATITTHQVQRESRQASQFKNKKMKNLSPSPQNKRQRSVGRD